MTVEAQGALYKNIMFARGFLALREKTFSPQRAKAG
jgi:hypothetical protein